MQSKDNANSLFSRRRGVPPAEASGFEAQAARNRTTSRPLYGQGRPKLLHNFIEGVNLLEQSFQSIKAARANPVEDIRYESWPEGLKVEIVR